MKLGEGTVPLQKSETYPFNRYRRGGNVRGQKYSQLKIFAGAPVQCNVLAK